MYEDFRESGSIVRYLLTFFSLLLIQHFGFQRVKEGNAEGCSPVELQLGWYFLSEIFLIPIEKNDLFAFSY